MPATVKPSNLDALKVVDFTCKIILVPFILVNSTNPHNSNTSNFKSSINIKHILTPFNFAVLFSSQSKRHANITGFTVSDKQYCSASEGSDPILHFPTASSQIPHQGLCLWTLLGSMAKICPHVFKILIMPLVQYHVHAPISCTDVSHSSCKQYTVTVHNNQRRNGRRSFQKTDDSIKIIIIIII